MISDYTPLSHFEEGQQYTQTFMVRDVSARATKSGRPSTYLLLTVQDVTGRIKGFVWDVDVKALRGKVKDGTFVHMTVDCVEQKWGKGFTAKAITPIDRPDDVSNFIYGPTTHQLSVYADDIRGMVDSIDDPDYRNIVMHAIDGKTHLIDHILTPMAYGTDSYAGGLLITTRRVMKSALATLDSLHDIDLGVDRSLIIAGSLLRNVGYYSLFTPAGATWIENPDTKGMLTVRQQSDLIVANLCQSAESDLKMSFPEAKKIALRNVVSAKSEDDTSLLEAKIVIMANRAVDTIVDFADRGWRYKRHQE